MGRQRRFLACTTALALAGAALAGAGDHVLALAPLLSICGLLLAGRYVGEDAIVARWRGTRARPPARRVETRWPTTAAWRPLTSLLARSPRLLRGPPAPLAA